MPIALRYGDVRKLAIVAVPPLEKETFYDAWEARDNFDFLTSQLGSYGDKSEAWSKYQIQAEPTLDCLDMADRAGAKIFKDANLADFCDVAATFEIVALLAHWRSHEFEEHHLLDTSGLISRLEEMKFSKAPATFGSSLHFEMIANVLEALTIEEFEDLKSSRKRTARFCGKLVQLITEEIADASAIVRSWLLIAAEARGEFDKIFEGLVAPGNRIEFCDGMYDPVDVASGGSPGKPTLFDLLVCKSLFFAVELKRHWGQDNFFIAGQEPVSMAARAAILRGSIQLVARENVAYEEAARRLRRSLADVG